MKELIRQHALALGFNQCRFTTAAPPASGNQFRQWLADQHHGEMAWMQKNAEKRMHPKLVLSAAQSIIIVAASYATQKEKASGPGRNREVATISSPTTGIIARYACFEDYHQIMGERLRSLVRWIYEHAPNKVECLWYVDTGPVLERDLAQRAGLGFVGKHTNLISRQHGNWLFLGEIITDLELEPDPPEKNRCGTCQQCLIACPTQAITAPFQLDARRCISYLTIELKGAIPVEFRSSIGRRIFGCDDCLAVCPWNRFAQAGNLLRAKERADLAEPNLIELLQLDEAGFKQRFGGTPVERLKRGRLLRNVSVALGNSGLVEAVPALERATRDPDALIAEHAQWAIEQIQLSNRKLPASDPAARHIPSA